MGHRLSKSNWISSSNTRNNSESIIKNKSQSSSSSSIVPTENFPEQTTNLQIGNTTLTVPGTSSIQTQFVIKIQLTKMEPTLDDNEHSRSNDSLDNNLNISKPILNLTFTKNILCDATSSSNDETVIDVSEIKLNNLNTAKSNNNLNNPLVIQTNFTGNLNNSTIRLQNVDGNSMKCSDTIPNASNNYKIASSNMIDRKCSKNANVINNNSTMNDINAASSSYNSSNSIIPENISNISSNIMFFGANVGVPESIEKIANNSDHTDDKKYHQSCKLKLSSAYPTTLRCCQIVNRECDNTRTTMPSSSSSTTVDTQQKSSNKRNWTKNLNCTRRNSSTSSSDSKDIENNSSINPHITENSTSNASVLPRITDNSISDPSVMQINNRSEPPRMCHLCDEREKRLRALQIRSIMDGIQPKLPNVQGTALQPNLPFSQVLKSDVGCDILNNISSSPSSWPTIFGQTVHSQADYIHCLVPDLKQITSSSFYWGKMDRYEAERLLDGKPEGTFLLRDSAQEEYLFSVTFRKYGRSLHARIEQNNHKFSFDCHDPGSFSAFTVTELLEHYKENCLMVFEPMLTIPLNRSFSFSLQQLCRATIVSNITYDGINQLHLPNSLKGYLKEYHYKFRVRVKPFDQTLYSCS